jgi:hypothetical protein
MTSGAWTVLKMQYRMGPAIRKIVSAISYNNELKDATEVLNRKSKIASVSEMIPGYRDSAVVVYEHSSLETKVL